MTARRRLEEVLAYIGQLARRESQRERALDRIAVVVEAALREETPEERSERWRGRLAVLERRIARVLLIQAATETRKFEANGVLQRLEAESSHARDRCAYFDRATWLPGVRESFRAHRNRNRVMMPQWDGMLRSLHGDP